MNKQDSEQKPTQPRHSSDHKDQKYEEEEEDNIEQSTSKSPSPPLHSFSDSPISDDHRSLPLVVQPPVVTAHRFQVEPAVITKVDPGAEEGFVGVKEVEREKSATGGDGGDGGGRRLRPDVSSLLRSEKVANLNKFLLGLRIGGFVFCLVSFSVLVADRKKGWALDSFYLYKEFRYSLSVNVIGFVYSGLQICDLVKYLISRKHIVEHRLQGYFTFALDQILTYLLMSASSSAATRTYDWESNWGHDKFPFMANASVVLSFIAFVVFALASLVSGSILCKF
ncbi:CASP-like protein 4A1 [Vicia villosa]|uniref:CASP-like protein 4A1 n=1 Tax=Vicia villosa TaxID=3911 RepID=UPI00273C3E00|nr:CASP-like protein 4A1 [Vicia villosa]